MLFKRGHIKNASIAERSYLLAVYMREKNIQCCHSGTKKLIVHHQVMYTVHIT